MNTLYNKCTHFDLQGHSLNSATKKAMRPVLVKCLATRWGHQYSCLSPLVFGDDFAWEEDKMAERASKMEDRPDNACALAAGANDLAPQATSLATHSGSWRDDHSGRQSRKRGDATKSEEQSARA
jgi:hypothetical protein